MKQAELLRRVGSLQQVAYARRICYDEGRARGLNAVEVSNGPMHFVILLDKCMDVSELSWKGERMTFLSKPGLNGRNPFDTHGSEAQRSIMGGLFFTCGYENICAPYRAEDGRDYPMHGRMRTSPAEHVSIQARWEDEKYVISVSGDIREAELFGENLLLHRTITTVYGEPELRVTDEIRNEAFRAEPLMLMYHCNMGYPFLDEGCRLLLPTEKVEPRDAVSAAQAARWNVMDAPQDNAEEFVYLHTLKNNADGSSFAALVNDRRSLALQIGFNRRELPYFGQWKSTGSGDYVMGLEPGNACVYGRRFHEQRGDLPMLDAQSEKAFHLSFRIFDGEDAIKMLENDQLLK